MRGKRDRLPGRREREREAKETLPFLWRAAAKSRAEKEWKIEGKARFMRPAGLRAPEGQRPNLVALGRFGGLPN